MKRAIAIADRIALPAMWLVAMLHLLFLASLLAIMGVAPASSQPACAGADLFTELKRSDPVKLAAIEAKAAKTPNGDAILWRIERDGKAPSWLFGTIHVSDPRVTALNAEARKAFDGAERLVIETTDVLDEARLMGQLAKRPDLMMFTDSQTLADLVSGDDAEILAKGLEQRGIPISSVAKMKPWMLMAAITLPACETARRASGLKMLDAALAADAAALGKDVAGLETGIEQMEAMASLPMDFHIQGLVDTLKLGARSDDLVETMISIYLQGRTNLFWPLFEATLGQDGQLGEGYAAFEKTIVLERNKTMVKRAEPLLAKGGTFLAVGAMHLPGQEGIVELLRARGYRVTPVLAT